MRYAVYFTPGADDPLAIAAASWLGRDAFSGSLYDTASLHSAPIASARRYGFHATLKAPFRLAEGQTEQDLLDAFGAFCAGREGFTIPQISLGQLGPFFALVEAVSHASMQSLCDDVVRVFEPFRAPLTTSDIERRKPETLRDDERTNLLRWGYPYVFEAFRFHMTLTDAVEEGDASVVSARLESHFAPFIGQPLTIGGLALSVEHEAGGDFQILTHQSFRRGVSL